MTAALDRFWDNAAVSATYNGSSVTVLADDFGGDREREAPADGHMAVGSIEVKKDDVSSPAYRDPVVIDGTTYRVLKIESHDWYSWKLVLYRDERPGPGGRR